MSLCIDASAALALHFEDETTCNSIALSIGQALTVFMSAITIECSDSVLRSLHETRERFAREVQLLAAVKLYELGRLSSGRAAELADMPRVMFFTNWPSSAYRCMQNPPPN